MRIPVPAAVVALLMLASPALALDPAAKCDSSKNKVAGKYASCRQSAEAKAIKTASSPDFTKCDESFDVGWQKAETSGEGMCAPNTDPTAMKAFITMHADLVATALSGSGVPECGDGVVNVAGEHCDGSDLDGYTCTSFSAVGTLSCTAGCDFDASACFLCPLESIGGGCWKLGGNNQSCDAACTASGMVADADKTINYAGSGGTNQQCQDLLDQLGAPGTGLDNPGSSCGGGFGCAYDNTNFRARCGSPATTTSAAATNVFRVCACKPS